MFGARFFAFFTAALAGSTVVSAMAAAPVVEARAPGSGAVEALAIKRQESTEAQVTDILNNLATTIAPTLASFSKFLPHQSPFVPAWYPIANMLNIVRPRPPR